VLEADVPILLGGLLHQLRSNVAYRDHVSRGRGIARAGAFVPSCRFLVTNMERRRRRTDLNHAFGGNQHVGASQGTVHYVMGFEEAKAGHDLQASVSYPLQQASELTCPRNATSSSFVR
jgi:hypothetical protein